MTAVHVRKREVSGFERVLKIVLIVAVYLRERD